MKKFLIMVLAGLISSQILFAQKTFWGSFSLKGKNNRFSLVSGSDTVFLIHPEKNILEFSCDESFQLTTQKKGHFTLSREGKNVEIVIKKKQVDFSTGLTFSVGIKKFHQIVLNDQNGNPVLDASYKYKGKSIEYTISVFDNNHTRELLSVATGYLFPHSMNEAHYVPYYYVPN